MKGKNMAGRRLEKKKSQGAEIKKLKEEVKRLKDINGELERELARINGVKTQRVTLERISGSKADKMIKF